MHTVLLNECIGCRLCVDPCPVDCIEMVPLETMLPENTIIDKKARGIQAKQRHKARQLRLQQEAQRTLPVYQDPSTRKQQMRQEIAAAIARVNNKV